MPFDQRGLDDYVDVAQRIADFRQRHPEGCLQPLDPCNPFEVRQLEGTSKEGKQFTATFLVYIAAAYRDRDDPRPGIGMAWEVFPGRTPYTLGSELMNAETSAWGRAIVAALASDSKRGVSSREEVRNREAEHDDEPAKPARKRVKTAHADAEHARIVQAIQPRGPVNGAKRTNGPVPAGENQWQDQPAGLLPEPEGTTSRKGIVAEFRRLGYTDRDVRLGMTAQLAGVAELASTNDLTDDTAERVYGVLKACTTRRKLQEALEREAVPS